MCTHMKLNRNNTQVCIHWSIRNCNFYTIHACSQIIRAGYFQTVTIVNPDTSDDYWPLILLYGGFLLPFANVLSTGIHAPIEKTTRELFLLKFKPSQRIENVIFWFYVVFIVIKHFCFFFFTFYVAYIFSLFKNCTRVHHKWFFGHMKLLEISTCIYFSLHKR